VCGWVPLDCRAAHGAEPRGMADGAGAATGTGEDADARPRSDAAGPEADEEDDEALLQLLLRRPSSPSGDEAELPAAAAAAAGEATAASAGKVEAVAAETKAAGADAGEVEAAAAGAKASSDAETDVADDADLYEDLFEMMKSNWPGNQGKPKGGGKEEVAGRSKGADPPSGSGDGNSGQQAGQGPGAVFLNPKRSRLPATQRLPPQDPLVGPHALARRAQGEGEAKEELPPEKVVAAYARLDLPLTATTRDVERKSRRLSRHAHPDKVPSWLRPQAARDFRVLQEAKAAVLAWMRNRTAPEDSDSPVGDATSDEEGGLLDPNAECVFGEEEKDVGYESPASEGLDEMKVCGARDPDGERIDPSELHGDSSAEEEEEAGPGDERGGSGFGIALAGGAFIRTEDGALDQAMALSRYEAGGAPRQRACGECLDRPAEEGSDVCRQCRLEMGRLWKRLRRG